MFARSRLYAQASCVHKPSLRFALAMGVLLKGTPKYIKWFTQQEKRKQEVRLEAAKAKSRKLLKNEIEQLRSEVDAATRRSNKHFRNEGAHKAAVAAARREKQSLIKKLAAAKGIHDAALELTQKARKEQECANDRLQRWEVWRASFISRIPEARVSGVPPHIFRVRGSKLWWRFLSRALGRLHPRVAQRGRG